MSDNDEKTPQDATPETAAESAGEQADRRNPAEQAPAEDAPLVGEVDPLPMPEPEDPIATLEAQAADLKDQLLRALAETENLRQRSRREREDGVRYAPGPLAKDMIEVADNLNRALEAVPAEAVEADEHLKNLITGVQMTEKSLQSVFERHNIRRIDPLGERLDPHAHEAIFEVPDLSQPAGTIVQVVRAGYRLHDRLLRAAQVGVAKGGPAPGAKPNGAQANGADNEPGSRVDTKA